MPSVTPIPFNEPRIQPANQQQSGGGDPFAELLASTARDEPQPRREPAAPKSRGETRTENLSRKDVKEAKPVSERRETAGKPVEAKSETEADAPADETAEARADKPQTAEGEAETSEPVIAEAVQMPAETEVAAGTTGSKNEGEAAKPAVQTATATEIPVDTGDKITDADAPAAAKIPVVAATDAAMQPAVAQPQMAAATAPAEGEAPVAGDKIAAPAPAAPDAETPVETASPETPVQSARSAAQADSKPAQTPAPAAVPIPASVEADAPDVAAPAPVPTRTAASNEPQQGQPAPQTNAPQDANEFSNLLQGDGDNASSQKQQDAPLTQAKPQDAKPAVADAQKPQASAPEAAAPKVQQPVMPEAVRVIANSFSTTNVNPLNFHASVTNDRVPVPLNSAALAVEIVSRMNEGMRRFDIRLDPPELGRVDVRLEVDRAGNVTTKLTVDRPETLDLMQRDARGLERALQQAGLKTDSGGLEFSLRSHADQGGMADGHAGRDGRERTPGGEDVERVELSIETYKTAALARGGVDIRI